MKLKHPLDWYNENTPLEDEHLNNILKLKENQHYCKTNPNKL